MTDFSRFTVALTALFFMATPFAHAQTTPPSFETLADNLLPTVVNVSTTSKIKGPEQGQVDIPQFPPGSPFNDFFKDFYDQFKNNNPKGGERKVSALGSGFVIDAQNGYIVTNNHVIKDADEIKVILHDDTSLDATLVGTDDKTDIAVLKIKPPKNLTAAHWGDSDKARVGSWILAIGNPFGLGGTVTAGIVSARQRNINAGPYDDFIQTDASINRGNSGGPMFNTNGDVIGINTAIFSPSGGSVGIGFAIPSNIARSVVDQLIKYGKTKRGWLGVRIQEVTPEIADSLNLQKAEGAMVSSIIEKSPAEKAGFKSGDVILTFNGQKIDALRNLPRLVADTEVGKSVPVTIWRDGSMKTISVTLGQLEKAEEEGMTDTPKTVDTKTSGIEVGKLGFSVAAINDGLRKTYNLKDGVKGVVITNVADNGAASDKGLQPGDVILEADQKDVATPEDVAKIVKSIEKSGKKSVLFFILRGDDRMFMALKLKDK